MTSQLTRLYQCSRAETDFAFNGWGLIVDYGACAVRVRSRLTFFNRAFEQLYRCFEYLPAARFADFHVAMSSGHGVRRFFRRQARFLIDEIEPFEPFALTNAFPLYEWGVNWCFGQRFNQYVLFHSGALAIGDRAVVMAATPGSGKSTLTAAMMLRGFRLLSDEFGVLDPATGCMLPMLKPVALKNRSIDVIRSFSDTAFLGPTFPGTRKGDVAHLAPDACSVDSAHRPARPVVVLFPVWREGAALELKPQAREQAFARLAFNSFNYALLGPVSFEAVTDVVASCRAFQLTYGSLEEAVTCVRELVEDSSGA